MHSFSGTSSLIIGVNVRVCVSCVSNYDVGRHFSDELRFKSNFRPKSFKRIDRVFIYECIVIIIIVVVVMFSLCFCLFVKN